MKLKKGAESAFQELKTAIGLERIQKLINDCYDSTEVSKVQIAKIMKLFEQKLQAKTDKSKDFRSFLKNQKQQVPKEDEVVAYAKTEDVDMN